MKRIKWVYRHYTNSKTSFLREKKGVFIGLVNHTVRWKGKQLAVVQFDGNKRTSKVVFTELVEFDSQKEI